MPSEKVKRIGCLSVVMNIIWFICGGLVLGILWSVAGLLLCITVIGIPFGLQCFKAASLSFAPFGKEVRVNFNKHPIANIIWLFLIGWEMAVGYVGFGIINCITIIGIPMGIRSFKMAVLALVPFGAEVV